MRKSEIVKKKHHCIHQTDSIFYGSLDPSFRKDGFGILQTFNFETYVGHWKNNKAEGIGMIIYPSGEIIYGTFERDTVEGIFLLDNHSSIILGVLRNQLISGIGYSYHYHQKNWKMMKYHKGVSIEIIKEEFCDIDISLPKMLNVEQNLFFHLHSYLNKNFFRDNKQFYENLTIESTFFGAERGPGLKIEKGIVLEAGFYEDGLFEGYGFKNENPDKYEFGCYRKGKKNGYFYEREKDK